MQVVFINFPHVCAVLKTNMSVTVEKHLGSGVARGGPSRPHTSWACWIQSVPGAVGPRRWWFVVDRAITELWKSSTWHTLLSLSPSCHGVTLPFWLVLMSVCVQSSCCTIHIRTPEYVSSLPFNLVIRINRWDPKRVANRVSIKPKIQIHFSRACFSLNPT